MLWSIKVARVGTLVLFPNLSQAFSSSTFSMKLAMDLSHVAFIMLKYIPSIHTFATWAFAPQLFPNNLAFSWYPFIIFWYCLESFLHVVGSSCELYVVMVSSSSSFLLWVFSSLSRVMLAQPTSPFHFNFPRHHQHKAATVATKVQREEKEWFITVQ